MRRAGPPRLLPCVDCIGRRQFLTTAAGAAGLLVMAGCGDGIVTGPFAKLPAGPLRIKVSDYPGLSTTGQLVKVTGEAIAVKRTGTSTFEALSLVCTHQGCLVGITSNTQLDCGCHGSRFGNGGEVVRGPNTGESINPLPKFPTVYNATTDELTIG